MSAKAGRVDNRLDNICVAHRLRTLIHPWPTLGRGASGGLSMVLELGGS
ncbi:MAG: hypothetical protein ACREYF_11350 [Gammaproteobacteria bacterium]